MALDIPLDSILRGQIQQLMQAVDEIGEEWGGSKPSALEVNAQGVMPVNNTIALVGGALFAALSYLHIRYEPERYVGEAWTLQEWIREAALILSTPLSGNRCGTHGDKLSAKTGEYGATFVRDGRLNVTRQAHVGA